MKKLYICDLDGTLLDKNAEITQYTRTALNKMLKKGLNFTVATARTAATVLKMLEGLNFTLPVVLMNGAAVYDMKNSKYIQVSAVPKSTAGFVCECAEKHGISGFLYTIDNNIMHTYYDELKTDAMRKFHDERREKFNKKFEKVDLLSELKDRNIVYFSFLNSKDKLDSLYEDLKQCKDITISYYRDIYYGDLWYLEISSKSASKRAASEFLKKYTGAERMACFGDNLNDIPMFEVCDEKYAVENAHEQLKLIADKVIGSNNEDGVVKFLEEECEYA